jgi:peptidoglycan endopeptidase LytE
LTAAPPRDSAERTRRRLQLSVRRRRATSVLAVGFVVLGAAAAATGAWALWAGAVAVGLVASGYLVLARRLRRVSVEHEMAVAFGPDTDALYDWAAFEAVAVREAVAVGFDVDDPSVVSEIRVGHAALARFLAAYALGWLLTPVVALIRAAGGDLGDLADERRYPVIARVIQAQQAGRAQSLRVLAAGLVATAGATGVTAVTAGGTASASPVVAQSATVSYTVQTGDTLGGIAAHFDTTVTALAEANGIPDVNLIFVGQVLSVPSAAPPETPATYTVVAGDTLGGIAAQLGTSLSRLAAINGITNPNLIYVGEVLHTTAAAQTAAAPTAAAQTTAAATAVRVALAQVGVPYVYGGASPQEGFDCSGLVMYAWAAAGVQLPHYSVSQYDDTERITEAQLQPGDLVFYDNDSGPQPGHVAMYIGNGQVVAANQSGTDVQTQSISYDGTTWGFGRVVS